MVRMQAMKTSQVLLLVAALILILASTQSAESIDSLIEKAERGDAEAQALLGVYSKSGRGVPKDDVEAAKWFRLAAEQGSVEAQYALGFQYVSGQGVPKDYVEAAKWFRLAAEQGHVTAQQKLGLQYLLGEGVPKNFVESYKWLNLAAAKGRDDAAKARETVSDLMTSDQVAEAQRLSREWKPKVKE